MIKLVVADYCHNCPEFEPDVDKNSETFQTWNPMEFCGQEYVVCDTIVSCKHRYRCNSIRHQLEIDLKKVKGEEK